MTGECWTKKALWVNLSDGTTRVEALEDEVLEKFLGGKGLGAYLLYKHVDNSTKPLDPENVLFFLTGPLQGLPAPNSGRWTLVTKSPLTGLFLDTHCGGALGREIKQSGYDVLCVTGKAKNPSILVVEDDSIQIRSASEFWGKGVYETTNTLKEQVSNRSSIYTIGPAGENLVKIATGCCEIAHQTGRGGAGAVMGSKHLKAVAVRGTKKNQAHDMKTIREIYKERLAHWKEKESEFKDHGTTFLVALANSRGMYPTRNWQSGFFEDFEGLDADKMEEKFGLGVHHSCPICFLRCTHAFRSNNPNNPDEEVESMTEYETLGMLGGNIGISNPESVFRLNYLCDDLGLDTISTGSTIAFITEAVEKGFISDDRIGFTPKFGDEKSVIRLIQMIAYREGIGDILAEGTRSAAEVLGHNTDTLAVHVKGLETAAWDPRGRKGLGMSYATAAVGASHLRGWPDTLDLPDSSAVPVIQSMISARDEKFLTDSMIVCHFTYHIPLTKDHKLKLINAATGLDMKEDDIAIFGQRIETLARMYNIREGASRSDDKLPPRFWKPEKTGPAKGMKAFMDRDDFERSLNRFYEIRGWDMEGVPTEKTLEELRLQDHIK
ncbi:MAG: aldehyde ferredoxin oxidoreductase [Candidatus Lokiarchaeota archaeon]|nr:aldehyde ferredoxin oxidoreductase [Candidatus Lokiarchaeota archaeon]